MFKQCEQIRPPSFAGIGRARLPVFWFENKCSFSFWFDAVGSDQFCLGSLGFCGLGKAASGCFFWYSGPVVNLVGVPGPEPTALYKVALLLLGVVASPGCFSWCGGLRVASPGCFSWLLLLLPSRCA